MKGEKSITMLSWIIAVVTLLVLVVSLNQYGITGFATDQGSANLTINTTASVAFYDDVCDFGSGAVEDNPEIPFDSATAWSNGTVIGAAAGSWNGCTDGLLITNDGNVNVSVNVSVNTDSSSFISGTGDSFKIKATTTACSGTAGTTAYTEIVQDAQNSICTDWDLGENATIDFELVIPEDATPGTSNAIITATATA